MKQTTDGIKTNFFRESIAFKTITGSCCNYCKTCHNKQQKNFMQQLLSTVLYLLIFIDPEDITALFQTYVFTSSN